MKRILTWLLTTSIVLSMTACGGKQDDPVHSNSTPTETIASPTSAPTDAPTESFTETPTQATDTKTTADPVINVRPSARPTAAKKTKPTATLSKAPTSAPTTKATAAPTKESATAPTTIPTTAATAAPIIFRHEGLFGKENVPEFMALFRQQYPKIAATSSYNEKYCYNDTPPKVAAETNIQFFTFTNIGKTLLLLDNKIYVLYSHSFGPPHCDRLVNALPYDFDGDGVKDLLIAFYVYTGGSFDNMVSVFNPVTKEFTSLYWWDDGACEKLLYVTESQAGGQITHTVSHVEWKYEYKRNGEDSELAYKEYTVAGTAGHIEVKDGKPRFVTANPTTYKYQEHYTKENVEEFVDLCYEINPPKPDDRYVLTVENCYNVTPPDVAKQTDIQIFADKYRFGLYIWMDDEVFDTIGTLKSAIVCDFDEDGNKDLLISSTFGNGVVYHQIQLFNSVTKEFTTLLCSDKTSPLQTLILARHSYDIEFVGKTEADYGVSYPVLLADNIYEDGYTVKHVVIDIIGHIEVVDGKLRFIPSE